jgi:hypothetical protein|nr:MAG TPA: zipper dimerization domain transcription factor-like protein [Caudoviricetes sp.]
MFKDNYNEELEQKVKRLEEQLTEIRIELLERKAPFIPYKPYEVEVPKDLKDYFFVNEGGDIKNIAIYNEEWRKKIYEHGHAFKTKEEAEQFDKERILIKKLKNWAKEQQGDWTPNWNDDDETIYEVQIDRFPMYGCDSPLVINEVEEARSISIFPYFYSHETAREFIDEFRGEIEGVFC